MSMNVTVGKAGIGKTHFQICRANASAEEGKKILFFTGEHEPNSLYDEFHLSKNIHAFYYENLSIETIKVHLDKEQYDAIFIDCILPLLKDADSKKLYYKHYASIYQLLELQSYKRKVDFYLTRQLPWRRNDKPYKKADIEEWEKRASSLFAVTDCHFIGSDTLRIEATDLHTGKKTEATQHIGQADTKHG